MGSVHVARLRGSHGVQKLFAIKVLHARSDDRSALASFLREARVTAELQHPNVVETYELGEDAGEPFIVMALVRGISLSRLLSELRTRRESLPLALAVYIAAEAAAGLHAAHELCAVDGRPLGVVHRDVSPQNLLLAFDGQVKVADFGIAKLQKAAQDTTTGVIKGKLGYLSPEQAGSAELDRRADLFALGIVMHEMLTAKRLFASESAATTLLHVVGKTAPDPRDDRGDVPETLARTVLTCLEKDRAKRYRSADQLATELRGVLRDLGGADASDLSRFLSERFQDIKSELTERVRRAVLDLDSGLNSATEAIATPERGAGASPSQNAPSAEARPERAAALAHGTAAPPSSGQPGPPKAAPRTVRRGLAVAVVGLPLVAAAAWFALRRGHQNAAQQQPTAIASQPSEIRGDSSRQSRRAASPPPAVSQRAPAVERGEPAPHDAAVSAVRPVAPPVVGSARLPGTRAAKDRKAPREAPSATPDKYKIY